MTAERCTEEKRRECANNGGPDYELALCPTCKKNTEPYVPSPWFQQIYNLYQLKSGGYPFEANDLSFEQWQDLGTLTNLISSRKANNILG